MKQVSDTVPAHKPVFELSRQGHMLLKARQFDEARTVFEEALAIDPDNHYVLTGMGDVLRHQKYFSEAAEYYRRVLKFDPFNLYSLLGLGDALRGVHCYQEAIGFWKIYIQQHQSKNIYVLTRIADSYKRLNDYDNSLAYYLEASAVAPDDRYVLLGLADLYKSKGLDLPAIEHYEKALAGGVTMVSILTIVGNLHLKCNNHETARNYFEKALELEPHNNHALHGLGNYYRKIHNYQRAVDLWEQILEKHTGTLNLLARLGDAYRNLGQLEAAERTYNMSLERGYDKFALVGMIKVHCLMGRLQDACNCYNEMLSNEGTDTRFFVEIGRLLIQRCGRDLALEFYHHVQQLQTNSAEASQIIENCIVHLDDPQTTYQQ